MVEFVKATLDLAEFPLSLYSVEKLDNLKMHDSSKEPFSSEVLSIYHV